MKSIKIKNFITGVKPSISNNQLLVSTGIPTFDIILGGGLPIGTIMMIEEDEGGCYSNHMTKYFIAEGVTSKHQIFVANLDAQIDDQLNNLPSLVNYEKYVEEKLNEELTIAWRYANLPKENASSNFSHYYDNNIKMTSEQLAPIKFHRFPEANEIICTSSCFDELLSKIKSCLNSESFIISDNNRPNNILRIVLNNFGSPQWWNEDGEKIMGQKLFHFFAILKSLVRTSYSCVIFTFPSQLYPRFIVSRIESVVDFAVKLDAFETTKLKSNQVYKDYQGLFHVIKFPHLNSLVSQNESDLSDLAFKLRRKRFTIEKLHLPPLFADEAKAEVTQSGCSSTISNKLDF